MKAGERITKRGLNIKGRSLSFFAEWFATERMQPIFKRLYLLALAGMNIGGATMRHEVNGELAVLRIIKSRFRPNDKLVIFDVGAHTGLYARIVDDVFGNMATIYCFEPSFQLFQQLKATLRKENFRLYRLGLSDEAAEIKLFSSDDYIPTALPTAFIVTGQELVSTESIKTTRLDTFCIENNVTLIDFLKIDVEGFELKVLLGSGDLLQKGMIKFIQFEFGQHCIASRSFMLDFYSLLNHSYRLFRILPNGLYELKSYNSSLENFVSATNYLAVSRKFGNPDLQGDEGL